MDGWMDEGINKGYEDSDNAIGSIMEIRVLHIIPYESSRKRMSMIVEMPSGEILLLCKVRFNVLR